MDKRANSDKFEQHGSDHGRVSSLTVTVMFSLIRRISYGVIPRPDRPWEGDGMFFFSFISLSYPTSFKHLSTSFTFLISTLTDLTYPFSSDLYSNFKCTTHEEETPL